MKRIMLGAAFVLAAFVSGALAQGGLVGFWNAGDYALATGTDQRIYLMGLMDGLSYGSTSPTNVSRAIACKDRLLGRLANATAIEGIVDQDLLQPSNATYMAASVVVVAFLNRCPGV